MQADDSNSAVALDTAKIKQAFSLFAGDGLYRRAGEIAGVGRQTVYDYTKGKRAEVVDTNTERLVINSLAAAIIEEKSEQQAAAMEAKAAALRANAKAAIQ